MTHHNLERSRPCFKCLLDNQTKDLLFRKDLSSTNDLSLKERHRNILCLLPGVMEHVWPVTTMTACMDYMCMAASAKRPLSRWSFRQWLFNHQLLSNVYGHFNFIICILSEIFQVPVRGVGTGGDLLAFRSIQFVTWSQRSATSHHLTCKSGVYPDMKPCHLKMQL